MYKDFPSLHVIQVTQGCNAASQSHTNVLCFVDQWLSRKAVEKLRNESKLLSGWNSFMQRDVHKE